MDKSNVSVLIVEDNEMNRDMLSRRLSNEDYAVQVAADGEQAIKLLEIEQFDIILLDIMMPGMDGYEVLEWIKTNPVHSETPVLMLTALTERESVVKSIELGATDYLVKPFDMAKVKMRMWKCLGNADIQQRYGEDIDMTDAGILVVDDDKMNRNILSRRLRGFGCQVDMAESGLQALGLLNERLYHLVVLDINMPDMNGVEVLRRIKANPDMADTAVIMVSANDEKEVSLQCLSLGAIDYISKPYNVVVLRARLEPIVRMALLNEVEKGKTLRLKQLEAIGAQLAKE
jgi:DNA-binding response OmpR family regulator